VSTIIYRYDNDAHGHTLEALYQNSRGLYDMRTLMYDHVHHFNEEKLIFEVANCKTFQKYITPCLTSLYYLRYCILFLKRGF
jgi:hypothetical protein